MKLSALLLLAFRIRKCQYVFTSILNGLPQAAPLIHGSAVTLQLLYRAWHMHAARSALEAPDGAASDQAGTAPPPPQDANDALVLGAENRWI